jgi:signal transduction histidine kinase
VRWRPSIQLLLLGINVFVLLVPALAVVFLRIYDTHLIQHTEARLIAEAVLIGEAWRDALQAETGIIGQPSVRPPWTQDERYFPVEPMLDLSEGILPAAMPPPTRRIGERNGPAWRAGERVTPLLERAQRVNLSGARLLDAKGCVVGTTGGDLGACLDHLPEVATALAGSYVAVARERVSDEPPPPLRSIRRRGKVRVFSAMPIWSDGEVIGVVRMSRTALDPLKSIWLHGDAFLLALALCLGFTVTVSYFFSHAITRPVRAITHAAQATAHGERAAPFALRGIVPDEVHRLSAALDRMTAQLTDRADYIAEFAATASHELKTPITGIRGAAELLRESWAEMSDQQRERFVANIEGDAARMQQLVSRLLQLARIQSAPEAAERIDLCAYFAGLAERYGDRVRFDYAATPDAVVIVREHLDSAVRNLIDNAVRHGGDAPVEVTVEACDGRLLVRVSDHGPGISEAHRDRVFQRFFTTERDRGGTGLGLAIVQAVADTRGGSIQFDSGSDGTCFRLVL